jgi:hypothetical protein
VEVFSTTAVKYSLEPVTVTGRFGVLDNNPDRLFYRMADAVQMAGTPSGNKEVPCGASLSLQAGAPFSKAG